jgi:anti-sigma B factor antagonist
MGLTFERKGEVGLVIATGSLTAAGVGSLREQFTGWWQEAADLRNVVIDLSDVEFIDSAGLGLMIAVLKRVSERGGDLKIAGLQKKVRMVLEITRAHKVFDIFDSVDEAVRACA